MLDEHYPNDIDDGLDEDIAPDMIELAKIPRRLWEQALAPLHPQVRFFVARQIADERLRERAYDLVTKLGFAESDARRARETARGRARRTTTSLPSPGAAHPAAQPTVQVNFRLRRDDYERLKEAAVAVDMKPTTLARALVLNGSGKILQDSGAT